MSYCTNCGHTLFEGAKFCHACGKKVITVKNNQSSLNCSQPYYHKYDKTEKLGNDYPYIKVWINGKVGLIDIDGQIVIPCDYDDLNAYCNSNNYQFSYAEIINNCKWGFYQDGREVIPCQYDSVAKKKIGHTSAYIVKQSGLLGLLNTDMWVCTECCYDSVETCHCESYFDREYDYFLVKRNGKYGVIDKYANILVPCKYDSISDDYIEEWGPSIECQGFRVYKNRCCGLYSYEGVELVPCEYKSIEYEGYGNGELFYRVLNKEGLQGLYPESDFFNVLDCCYETIEPLYAEGTEGSDYYCDMIRGLWLGFIVKKNGRCFFLSQQGYPLKNEFNSMNFIDIHHGRDFKYTVRSIDNKYGIIKLIGAKPMTRIIEECRYDQILSYKHDGFKYRIGDRSGIKNYRGESVAICCDDIDDIYFNNSCETNERLYKVYKGGKWGVVNRWGEEVVPYIYDSIETLFDKGNNICLSGILIVRDKNLYGCIKVNERQNLSNIILPLVYDSIIAKYGYLIVSKCVEHYIYKKGVASSRSGKILIQPLCSDVEIETPEIIFLKNDNVWKCYRVDNDELYFLLNCDKFRIYGDVIIYENNNRYGISTNLSVTTSCIYEEIDDLGELTRKLKWLKVKYNGAYGIVSVKGDIIIDLKYDKITEEYWRENGNDIDALRFNEIVTITYSDLEKQWNISNYSPINVLGIESINSLETKTKYLFFDTETTGIPKDYKAPASDLNNWPRLVQLGWILTDDKGNEIASGNDIIKPNGFAIPIEASRVHRITTDIAYSKGVDLTNSLQKFMDAVRKAEYIVGHNIAFDIKIVEAELIRTHLGSSIESKPSICTMLQSIQYCAIPSDRPYGDKYKWPKLLELHKKLFGYEFEDAHDAMADIRATKKCFFAMKGRGLIK